MTVAVEQHLLRSVLGRFATGVTVLTTAGARPHGMTCNAFTSVSLAPPLVLVCVGRTARMHQALCQTGCFAVSVLAAGQESLARYFANATRPEGAAQFDTVAWTPGERTGAPLLGGALATLECAMAMEYPGGDHSLFLGRVLAATGGEGEPLLFYGGRIVDGTSPVPPVETR